MRTATATRRVVRSTTTLGLALADLFLILLFVVLGELQHYGLAGLARVPVTAAPFVLGWALAAVALGLYGTAWLASPRAAALRTAGAWVVAVAVGQGLRATPYLPGDAAPAFVVVSLGIGMVLLVPWRVAAVRFELV
jgi:hypothetical protein